MPGVFVGGGLALSNTALLILGAGLITAAYFHMDNWNKKKDKAGMILREEMKPGNIEDKIMGDVIANAAYTDTALNNRDRIQEAIKRMKPRLKEIRDNYRDGIISRDEFIAEVRGAWQTVATTLGIPTLPPSQIPKINKGIRGGQWRKLFSDRLLAGTAQVQDRNLTSPGLGWAYAYGQRPGSGQGHPRPRIDRNLASPGLGWAHAYGQ